MGNMTMGAFVCALQCGCMSWPSPKRCDWTNFSTSILRFMQEIDGLREEELAGKKIGTTKRGIGPAYASKAYRNGIRVGDLRDMDTFAAKLRNLAQDGQQRFSGFQYDVEASA